MSILIYSKKHMPSSKRKKYERYRKYLVNSLWTIYLFYLITVDSRFDCTVNYATNFDKHITSRDGCTYVKILDHIKKL